MRGELQVELLIASGHGPLKVETLAALIEFDMKNVFISHWISAIGDDAVVSDLAMTTAVQHNHSLIGCAVRLQLEKYLVLIGLQAEQGISCVSQ